MHYFLNNFINYQKELSVPTISSYCSKPLSHAGASLAASLRCSMSGLARAVRCVRNTLEPATRRLAEAVKPSIRVLMTDEMQLHVFHAKSTRAEFLPSMRSNTSASTIAKTQRAAAQCFAEQLSLPMINHAFRQNLQAILDYRDDPASAPLRADEQNCVTVLASQLQNMTNWMADGPLKPFTQKSNLALAAKLEKLYDDAIISRELADECAQIIGTLCDRFVFARFYRELEANHAR